MLLLSAAALVVVPLLARAQAPRPAAPSLAAGAPDAPLPFDSTVLRGRLPNGIRYLVRRNSPRIAPSSGSSSNAGSILEDEPQLGVAHFVEHMAFNGTRRFPKADLVNFLERTGVRFGPDLNAYTSFDETVYMLQIPTDTAAIVSKALDILEDWAHGLAFDSTEIRKERGVVVEEWRSGRGAQMRMTYKQFPVILRGSKYATRLPIGTRENLQSLPRQPGARVLPRLVSARPHDRRRRRRLRSEADGGGHPAALRAHPRRAASRARASTRRCPATPRRYVSIESDKEYPNASRHARAGSARRGGRARRREFRRALVNGFYDRMVNARLSEITQRAGRALRVRRHGPRLVHAHDGRAPALRRREGERLREGRRRAPRRGGAGAPVRLHGERARSRAHRTTCAASSSATRSATRPTRAPSPASTSRARSTRRRSSDIADEQTLAQRFAPTVTLDEINALARASFPRQDRVVIVAAPDKPEIKLPTRAEMLGRVRSAGRRVAHGVRGLDVGCAARRHAADAGQGRLGAQAAGDGHPRVEALERRARSCSSPATSSATRCCSPRRAPAGSRSLPDTIVTQAELASMALDVGGLGTLQPDRAHEAAHRQARERQRVHQRRPSRGSGARVGEGPRDAVPARVAQHHPAARRLQRVRRAAKPGALRRSPTSATTRARSSAIRSRW